MFGPRISTVFTSRWKALLWSMGILMTAYCAVPSPDDPSGGAEGLASSVLGKKSAGSADQDHVNPWAKSTDKPAD